MRRLRFIAAFLAISLQADWDIGLNFRGTPSLVVDPPYATSVNETLIYPTTVVVGGQSVTMGWETPPYLYFNDVSATADPRIAGQACRGNGASASVFRVDLPATGDYDIRLAAGDIRTVQQAYVSVLSDATTLLSVSGNTTADFFLDSAGNIVTGASWLAANTKVRKNFSSTTLRITLGGANAFGYTCLAHVRVTKVALPIVPSARAFFIE